MRIGLLAVLLATFVSKPSRSDDWPQWFGPRRDGVWRETGLISTFPSTGLPIRWRMAVAGGYAGPAISNGRVYLLDRVPAPEVQRPANPFKRITQPGKERVLCIDANTGKLLWENDYDADYTMSYSIGPRTTPAVDGDLVFTLGGEGDLRCLHTADGSLVWSTKLSNDDNKTPTWGFACHPLVDGDRLIIIGGGHDPSNGHGLITTFDKKTGKPLWSALACKEPGYAPPVIVNVAGVRQLIVWDPDSLNSLDPDTGAVYWAISNPYARNGGTIVTPRYYHDPTLGDLIMVSTQYEGTTIYKLDSTDHTKAAVLWHIAGKTDKKSLALHTLMATSTIRAGHIYGVDTYGELRCLKLENGERVWESTAVTTEDQGPTKWASAFLIPLTNTGNRFLIATEHGDLVLADLDPSGYHEISRTHLLDPTNSDPGRPVLWCFPGLADRCVFWRNDKELVCASMAADK